jgi:hypothetical protein
MSVEPREGWTDQMIERRLLLKLSGFLAVASALDGLSMATQRLSTGSAVAEATPPLQAPGTYQFSGRVRLQEPLVEISGIANAQQISWSPGSLRSSVASFTSFEQFDRPWHMPEIRVRGGQLEALTVMPLDFG